MTLSVIPVTIPVEAATCVVVCTFYAVYVIYSIFIIFFFYCSHLQESKHLVK